MAGTVGGYGANEIANLRATGILNGLEHKFVHGLLGGAMGALYNFHHPLQGLLPGFIGGAGSEMVAEGTDNFLGRRVAGNLGLLAPPILAFLLNQDVDTAGTTAINAIMNNYYRFIPYILASLEAAGTAWLAHDIYETYQQEGPEAALKRAGEEVVIMAATGGAGKLVVKVGGKLYPSIEAAWQAYSKTNPQLMEAIAKGSTSLSKAKNAVGNSKVGQITASYWNKLDTHTFQGQTNKVFKRDDLIDLNRVDPFGNTNAHLMGQGKAPIGPDGRPLNLHHMLQTHDGALAEVTATFHQKYKKIIHINPSSTPSGINRSAFDTWRSDYWKNRLVELEKK